MGYQKWRVHCHGDAYQSLSKTEHSVKIFLSVAFQHIIHVMSKKIKKKIIIKLQPLNF